MNVRIDMRPSHGAKYGPLVDGLMCSPLMAGLAPDVLETLAAGCHVKRFQEKDVLCQQGDAAHSVWLVLDGWVKLTRETLDGGDAVWDVLGATHLVGMETLVPPHTYTTRVEAVSEGQAVVMPHAALTALLDKNTAFARMVLHYMLRLQYEEKLDIEHRAQQTAPQRIGCFLLKLAGAPTRGAVDIHLPFDKGLLAARLGMQPETFSRALAKLKQETGMSMVGSRMEIADVASLQQYACGACSGSYPCVEA